MSSKFIVNIDNFLKKICSSWIFGRVWFPNLYQTGEPTMTDEIMNLRTLLEKGADADLLEMVRFAAQRGKNREKDRTIVRGIGGTQTHPLRF